MQDNADLEKFKNEIIDLTKRKYEQSGKGLLLSMLGQTLADYPNFKNILQNIKLTEFIDNELAASVKILKSPENEIVRITLPSTVTVEGNMLHLFPKRGERSPSNKRYNPALWAAFSKPLVDNHTRLIGFEPRLHFKDIESTEKQDTANIKVKSSLIVTEDMESDADKRVTKICSNITNWIRDNNVSDADAIMSKTLQTTSRYKNSTLDLLIDALPESDLKRIQMPLDVIAKLLRWK